MYADRSFDRIEPINRMMCTASRGLCPHSTIHLLTVLEDATSKTTNTDGERTFVISSHRENYRRLEEVKLELASGDGLCNGEFFYAIWRQKHSDCQAGADYLERRLSFDRVLCFDGYAECLG